MNKIILFLLVIGGIMIAQKAISFLLSKPLLDVMAWSFIGIALFAVFRLINYAKVATHG